MKLEWRNDHGLECSCFECVMFRAWAETRPQARDVPPLVLKLKRKRAA